MGLITQGIDIFLHLDTHLNAVIHDWGAWSYLILFIVIFAETGLVVTPFLPGDSLLFAAGALTAIGGFNLSWLFITLSLAAIIGDSVNYSVGKKFGESMFRNPDSRIFKKEYLDRTHRFYEKHGAKTIVIARFMPIIRTFAPFVAGMGKMRYPRFFAYNVTGGLLWVAAFVIGGYYFGNVPAVKHNFSLVILGIIVVSVLPGVVKFWQHHRKSKSNGQK
ncbi:MAG: DedA family protein [Candidatus Aureabacteria bacterium]|nr:DedA family protein [Candidatus Auribacterota bacterium]